MNLTSIVAVSGKPGLYRLVSHSTKGYVIESLEDAKRSMIPPTARLSVLSDITLYAASGDIPLKDVLMGVHQFNAGLPSPKSSDEELFKFMNKVLPDFDRSKVYGSDIRKIVKWYSLLKGAPEWTQEDPADAEDGADEGATEVSEEKAAGKKTTKAASGKKEATDKKPAAKAAKKETEAEKAPAKKETAAQKAAAAARKQDKPGTSAGSKGKGSASAAKPNTKSAGGGKSGGANTRSSGSKSGSGS